MNHEISVSNYDLSISYAYHLHEAELFDISYKQNRRVAKYAAMIGDLDISESCYKIAIEDAKKLKIKDDEMDSLYALTNSVLMSWGRYEEALLNFVKLSEYYADMHDLRSQSRILLSIGNIYARKRDDHQALENLFDSLRLSKTIEDHLGIARSLHEIGNVYRKQEKYYEALKNYNESLLLKKQLEGQPEIAITLHEIGNVYRKQKKHDEALKNYNESLEISKSSNDQQGIARSLHEIGNVYRKQKKHDEALKNYNESLILQTKIGNRIGISRSLHEIGNVYKCQGKDERALENYHNSLSIKRAMGVKYDIAITVLEIGSLFIKKKEYYKALPFTIESYILLKELDNTLLKKAFLDKERLQDSIGETEFYKLYIIEETKVFKRYQINSVLLDDTQEQIQFYTSVVYHLKKVKILFLNQIYLRDQLFHKLRERINLQDNNLSIDQVFQIYYKKMNKEEVFLYKIIRELTESIYIHNNTIWACLDNNKKYLDEVQELQNLRDNILKWTNNYEENFHNENVSIIYSNDYTSKSILNKVEEKLNELKPQIG